MDDQLALPNGAIDQLRTLMKGWYLASEYMFFTLQDGLFQIAKCNRESIEQHKL